MYKASQIFIDYHQTKNRELYGKFQAMSSNQKSIQIIYYVVVAYWFIACFFDIFPCHFLNKFLQLHLPIDMITIKLISWLACVFPTVLIFSLFNKDLIK